MATTSASKKIDVAFNKFPPDIQEITNKIRFLIHTTEPSVHEGWKWGPAFEKSGLLFGLWGFQKHVSFVFYRGAEMSDKHQLFNYGFDNAHNRMIKLTSLKDFNAKKFADYIKEAVKLDAAGKMVMQKIIALPPELSKWFAKNKKSKTFFDSIAYTYRKEMVQLLISAKQEETRKKRFEKITNALSSEQKTI
jgi:hypothetical protein